MEQDDGGRSNRVTAELSSAERRLLQASLEMLAPDVGEVAALFYERLFVLDPSLRLLFRRDMVVQRRKWISTLTLMVRNLDRPAAIVPLMRELGRRHRDYGVRKVDYALVGEALLWALGQVLGEAFSEDVRQAWQKAYLLLADLMQSAAAEKRTDIGL